MMIALRMIGLLGFLAAAALHPVHGQQEESTTPTRTPTNQAFYFDFLDYRYDLHRRVIRRWESLVQSNRDKLVSGRVFLRYYVNSDGFISVIESEPGRTHGTPPSNRRKLAAYALALENKDPVPFPDTVRQQYPHGFFYQIRMHVP